MASGKLPLGARRISNPPGRLAGVGLSGSDIR